MKNTSFNFKKLSIYTLAIIILMVIISLSISTNITYADTALTDYLVEGIDGITLSSSEDGATLTLTKNIDSSLKIKDQVGNVTLNLNGFNINGSNNTPAILIVSGGEGNLLNLTVNGSGYIYAKEGCIGISSQSSNQLSLSIKNLEIYAGEGVSSNGGDGIKGNFNLDINSVFIYGGKSTEFNGGNAINVGGSVEINSGYIVAGDGVTGGNGVSLKGDLISNNTNISAGNGTTSNGGNAVVTDGNVEITGANITAGSSTSGNGGVAVQGNEIILDTVTSINGGSSVSGKGGDAVIAESTVDVKNTFIYSGSSESSSGGSGIIANDAVILNGSNIVAGDGSVGGTAIKCLSTVDVKGGELIAGSSVGSGKSGGTAIDADDDVTIESTCITGGNGGKNGDGGTGVLSSGDVYVSGYNYGEYVKGGNGGISGDGGAAIDCKNVIISKIDIVGGNGGDGLDTTSSDGGDGGNGAVAVSANTIEISDASLKGGNGGTGGSSVLGDGGNGGQGADPASISVTSSSSTIAGGNGGNGGNTEEGTVGSGGLSGLGGVDGKNGLDKAQQVEAYLLIYKEFINSSKYLEMDEETSNLSDEAYEKLKRWLTVIDISVKENTDLVDEYLEEQFAKIYDSILSKEVVKVDALASESKINITNLVTKAKEDILALDKTNEDGYVLFKDIYNSSEDIISALKTDALSSYKDTIKLKIEELSNTTLITEQLGMVGLGKDTLCAVEYDNTLTLTENYEFIDVYYSYISKFVDESNKVVNLFNEYTISGAYTGERVELLNAYYTQFKTEIYSLNPISEILNIDALKEKYNAKLVSLLKTRIKTGNIDFVNLDKNLTYDDTFNGYSLWGYVENENGIDSSTSMVLSIVDVDRLDEIKKAVKSKSVSVAKNNELSSDLLSTVKNKDVKAVLNISLYSGGSKIEKESWEDGLYKVSILLTDEISSYDGLQVVDISNGVVNVYNTTIDGNYLVFYTTHFSEYIVLGNKNVDLTWLIILFACLIAVEIIALVIIFKKKENNFKQVKTLSIAPSILSIVGVTLIPNGALAASIVLGIVFVILLVAIILILTNIINIDLILFNKSVEKYKEEEFGYEVWVVEKKEELVEENIEVKEKKKRHKKNKK